MNKRKILMLVSIFVIIIIGVVFYVVRYGDIGVKNEIVIIDDSLKNTARTRIEELKKELASNPENFDLKRELSRAYYLIGELDTAEQIINDIKSTSTQDHPQWYVDIGNVYEAKGDFFLAEESYKKAIELNTKEFPNPAQIIPVTIYIGEVATSVFPAALPPIVYNLPTPYVALGGLYLNFTNQPEKAIQVFLEGSRVLPDYSDFYLMLSEIYKKIGDTKQAEVYMQKFNDLTKK